MRPHSLAPALVLNCCLLLAACAEPTPRLSLANPASQFCLAQGGILQIVDTPQGQHGLCRLPDGQEVEEWTLFRAMQPQAKP
jgi:putative hemolysin